MGKCDQSLELPLRRRDELSLPFADVLHGAKLINVWA